MDAHVIYPSQAAAEAALYNLNSRAMDLWASAGYEVDRQRRIMYGKRGDGSTDYSAITTTWDEVRHHPDGIRAFFANPAMQYPEYAEFLLSGHDYVVETVVEQAAA